MVKNTYEHDFFFHRIIKTLFKENVNSMSEHIDKAMDKIEFYLDLAIADKNVSSTEKSNSK